MLLLLAACGVSESSLSHGSSTIVADPDRATVVNVNVDEGSLSRIVDARAETLAVGAEPSRVAMGGGAYFVTLRAERGVAKVDADRFTVVQTGTVGAEPIGIVATEDGTRVYVASSQSNEVEELDGDTLAVLRSFPVADHPSWLALHPSEKTLWVASQLGGRLSYIDLEGGAVTEMPLPDLDRGDGTPLTPRLTGDPGISPSGDSLVVPGLFVDIDEEDPQPKNSTAYYASVSETLSRLNSGLVQVALGADGQPAEEKGTVAFVGGEAYINDNGGSGFARSYLTSARYSPDGLNIWATMEASENVVVVARDLVWIDPSTSSTYTPEDGGMWHGLAAYVHTDLGPRGVAFLDGAPYVHSFLDRSVARMDTDKVQTKLDSLFTNEYGMLSGPAPRGTADASVTMESFYDWEPGELGRRLFYSATDAAMVSNGGGVSCSTCHFEGRNDGLSWPLDNGPRQTPNLAGLTDDAAPFTWTEDVATVADEAMLTTTERMGGSGPTTEEAEALATWLASTRPIDVPTDVVDAAAAARGAAIFAREDVGCATCHGGARFADGLPHDVYGVRGVDTPSLVGIAATAPYLHDGRAATLRELLEGATNGQMGDTSMLSSSELDDLEAYLRTL